MVDSTLAFNILARDLGASSVFEKVARSADNTSSSLSKTVKVSDQAAKASERLTKAHDNENDALGRVRTAEARLAEIRSNGNAKTSQIVRAEEALASARRKAAAASNTAQKAAHDLGNALDDEGKKAGKGFGSSLKKWFTGDGKNVFKQVGEDGGTVFGSGLLGALKTPILGPAIIGVVGAAVATAAPAVGAIAGAGIVAGFGAGLATLGIVFAAKSQVVQDKWKSTLAQMGADMKLLSRPFESTLISIAGTFQKTFDQFNPVLAQAFQRSAVPIENFSKQAAAALLKLKPAIIPVTDAFNAILDATGPALQDAVQSLSEGLIDLANSVRQNPQALADMVRGVGALSKDLLGVIKTLNDANTAFSDMTGGTSLVTATFEGMRFVIQGVTGPLTLLAKTIEGVSGTVNALTHSSDASGQSMADAAAKTVALAKGMQTAGGAAQHAAGPVKTLAERTAEAKKAAAEAKQKFEDFISSLFKLQNLALTLSGAQVGLAAAINAATVAAKENGKTLSLNTEKGRANRTALDAVAKAANDQTEAMIRAGKSNLSVYAAAGKSREGFVKLGVQMGLSKAQAQKLASQLIAIPNVSREARLTANKADLDKKLAAAKAALNDKNLTKERRAQLNADIKRLQAAVNAAQAKIDSLHGKVVPVTIKYSSTGVNLTTPSSVGRRASGGPVEKGKPYIVGEKRPELFVPKQDGTILPKVPTLGGGIAAGMAAGLQGGTSSAVSAAASLANAVITKTKEVLGISSPSKVFTQLALYVGQGFNRGIRGSAASIQSAMSSLMSKVVNLGFSRVKQSRILKMLQMENKGLQLLVVQRSKVADQLKGAQARLAAAVQVRDEFKKSITDAALSFNAITNVIPSDPNQSFTSKDIIARMQNTLQKTRDFARVLAALKARGLNATLYKQIAEAGVESGGALADALLGGGSGAIKNVNSLQAQINSASAGLGNTAAKNLYQAGVDAAQGLVNGLLAKTKALALASKKLADAIVAQIKRTLGIKSPSRVLEWHGSMAGRGFAAGIEGEYGAVRRAGIGLGNSAVPNARPRRAAPAGVQRIVLEFRTDGTPHMERLAREVRQYVRVVGGGDVQKAFGVSGR